MHNVLIIFYIAFSIGNLFILPELAEVPGFFMSAAPIPAIPCRLNSFRRIQEATAEVAKV